MTLAEQIITIALCAFATMLTRFLPFIIFSEKRKTPAIIQYLGEKLPAAIFGMLVVYCLRNVNIMQGNHGIPEAFSIIVTIILHLWRKQLLLSIAGGTATYMLFIQFLS